MCNRCTWAFSFIDGEKKKRREGEHHVTGSGIADVDAGLLLDTGHFPPPFFTLRQSRAPARPSMMAAAAAAKQWTVKSFIYKGNSYLEF